MQRLALTREEATRLNVEVANNRKQGFSKFLSEASSLGPQHQLLAATVAVAILSSNASHMENLQQPSSLSVVLSPSNVNYSTTMLSHVFKLSTDIATFTADGPSSALQGTTAADAAAAAAAAAAAGGSQPPPRAAVPAPETEQEAEALEASLASELPEKQLLNVCQFAHVWVHLMQTSAMETVPHPVLGKIPFVQPFVSSVVEKRVLRCADDDSYAIFSYLLERGADPNLRNSLGFTPLMWTALSLAYSVHELDKGEALGMLCEAADLLLAKGADATATAMPLALGAEHKRMAPTAFMSAVLPLLLTSHRGSKPFTARMLLASMRPMLKDRHASGSSTEVAWETGAAALDRLERALEAGEKRQRQQQGGGDREGSRLRLGRRPVAEWGEAAYNILWTVSQVMLGNTPHERLQILTTLHRSAPFALPQLAAINAETLQKLGKIPRYSTRDSASELHGAWAPTFAEDLPSDAVLVFLSHRWLGNGHPDNEQGDKVRQILEVARLVAEDRKCPITKVFLWLDYAVIDQADPTPGIQALPAYIACSHVFAYIYHEHYWERAWCLTEQFVRWRLLTLPAAASAASGGKRGPPPMVCLREGRLVPEAGEQKPPDPSLGKLGKEGERVVLATITGILGIASKEG